MSAPQKSSRWGSFLSQAVAGVEARLDNILAEEDAAKQQQADPATAPAAAAAAATSASAPPPRAPTPSKPANDRLQERLARAVATRNTGQRSDAGSRGGSIDVPSTTSSPRPSSDAPTPPLVTATEPEITTGDAPSGPSADLKAQAGSSLSEDSPNADIEDASHSVPQETEPALSAEVQPVAASVSVSETAAPNTNLPADATPASVELYEQRITALERSLEEAQTQHQEELHSHVERVDALQAKLQYMAREASQAARGAASAAPAGSLEKKLAEKDNQVAQLMEEGQKLAGTEQKHRSIIKRLRAQLASGEKEINEQKIWRQKADQELKSLRSRVGEVSELTKANKEAQDLTKQLRRELEKSRAEIATKDSTIADLQARLQEESDRATAISAKVDGQLRAAEQQRVKELEDTVAALEVEKNLAADRAKSQAAELAEKAERAAERARAIELELKGEINILESKLEAMRARAEEASFGAGGDAQAKLLRQIETLQTQYSIASENWQGMETSLMARAAGLEKERDEALRRESEMRKKARETASRAKRQEEELEEAKSQLPSVQRDLSSYQDQMQDLRKRAEAAESALAEARAEFEKQRNAWKEEKAERTDPERRSWLEDVPASAFRSSNSRPESPLLTAAQRTFSSDYLGLQSYPSRFRKASAPSSNGDPSPSDRPSSARRTSAQPPLRSPMLPMLSQASGTPPPPLGGGLDTLASPSTHPADRDDVFEGLERSASPQNMLQDMVSVTTTTAGPSVQLVERMSAAIRRLESEKVAAREELSRISSQRDEARAEIVSLIKEVEGGKAAASKVGQLEKEVAEINERYQTTLEMLGEKSELVEELRADVQDVKAMYRDLVERTIK